MNYLFPFVGVTRFIHVVLALGLAAGVGWLTMTGGLSLSGLLYGSSTTFIGFMIGIVSAPVWAAGALLIAAPVWAFLHRSEHRSRRRFAMTGGALVAGTALIFLPLLAALLLPSSFDSFGQTLSAIAAGWLYMGTAFGSGFMAGQTLWVIAYGPD